MDEILTDYLLSRKIFSVIWGQKDTLKKIEYLSLIVLDTQINTIQCLKIFLLFLNR